MTEAAYEAVPQLVARRMATNPWLIAGAVMAATFMEVLDTTIVNVALPHIGGNLSATTEEATWVLTSYLVANAIVLPMTGWLGRTFGRKRFLIGCIIIFTAASALCGAATTLPMLIIARILQGAGGGALQPISQAILLETFPPAKRGLAMSVFGMGVVVAPIIGPTLGGWMTDNYSWRWVFYVNLPVGLAAATMVYYLIYDPPYLKNARPGRMDFIGFGLLASWIGCLQFVLDKGQQSNWFDSQLITILATAGGLCLIAFIIWEIYTPEPLVNLRILANRNFGIGTLLMTVMGIVLYGCTALLPLFLQTLLNYPALQSGLTVSPRGFGSVIGMIIVGRIVGIIDSRILIVAGLCILGYSTMSLASLNLDISSISVTWPNVFNGFSTAMIFVPLTTMTMGTLKNEQMGNATGIFNLMRNLGGGIGIAMVTTMLARGGQTHQAMMVSHLTPYDSAYVTRVHALSTIAPASDATAQRMIYGELLRQASLLAYVDNFRLLAFLCFFCLPLVLLFKKPKAFIKPIMGH